MAEDTTTVGVVAATLGTVFGIFFPAAVRYVRDLRKDKAVQRKDAMEEVYRLYSEVKQERDNLRGDVTTYLIQKEQFRGQAIRLRDTACHLRQLILTRGVIPLEELPEVEDVEDFGGR